MSLALTIDNGGTFTDACLFDGEKVVTAKALTTPHDLTKCFIEVIGRIADEFYGPGNLAQLITALDYIRYSTTAGTNAIVQRKGPRLGLILDHHADPSMLTLLDAEKEIFAALVDDRVVNMRVSRDDGELEDTLVAAVNGLLAQGANRIVVSLNGPNLAGDERRIKKTLLRKYPRHLLGAVPVLFSHELTHDTNENRRTWSALLNYYLHPGIEQFLYNAEGFLRENRTKNPLLIFHNDGNSARVAKTAALKTYGSGPRGGMEGARALSRHYGIPQLLTLDVGGTTSDIGYVGADRVSEQVFGEIEGIETSFPLTDLKSLGVGGSSVFHLVDGVIQVGPQSVGAYPGPACFARGGQDPTITDAYLLMGVLDPKTYFRGNLTLDASRSEAVIREKIAGPLGLDLAQALLAMEKAYEEKIAAGLKEHEANQSATLLAFGGAGPLSACGVARAAGLRQVIVPQSAAVFSAFGISFSEIAHEYQTSLTGYGDALPEEARKKLAELQDRGERDMFAEGYGIDECESAVAVSYWKEGVYHRETVNDPALALRGMDDADDIRVHYQVVKPIAHYALKHDTGVAPREAIPVRTVQILGPDGKFQQVLVFSTAELAPGTGGAGPVLIEDNYFTCRVPAGWRFRVTSNRDIFLTDEGGQS